MPWRPPEHDPAQLNGPDTPPPCPIARRGLGYIARPAYRARAVIEPRAVLAEFGTHIPDDVEIRVSDSTAMVRYLVLPKRPEGSADFNEEQLAALVTRDTMIGVVPVHLAVDGGISP